jgi:hypothetical protein
MIVDLQQLSGGEILAGAPAGKAILRHLLEITSVEPREPTTLFLDFRSVKVATASFLRESALEFRNIVRARRSTYYPVVANPNEDVLDELREMLIPRREVMLVCFVKENEAVTRSMIVGELDPKQQLAFDLVRESRETDAGELMRKHGGVTRTTAWNNRLSSLSGLGLVFEVPVGRAKRYRAIF